MGCHVSKPSFCVPVNTLLDQKCGTIQLASPQTPSQFWLYSISLIFLNEPDMQPQPITPLAMLLPKTPKEEFFLFWLLQLHWFPPVASIGTLKGTIIFSSGFWTLLKFLVKSLNDPRDNGIGTLVTPCNMEYTLQEELGKA